MRATVRKWGNSASVRIPASVMKAANLDLDMAVDVREEDGRIVIEAIKAPDATLDELIDGINTNNVHASVDFGDPVGRELL